LFVFGVNMEDVKRLSQDNVPTLKKVWIHNNDVCGIDEDGEPIILAHVADDEEPRGTTPPHRKRAPRRAGARSVSTAEGHELPPEE
jgi:hypothetical protein